MKYFTKELFSKLNSTDFRKVRQADRKWLAMQKTYFEQHLAKIKCRMPPKLFHLATRVDLQDGVFLNFTYGDYFEHKSKWQKRRQHCAELRVLHGGGKYIYTLVFRGIRKCVYDYPTEDGFLDEYNKWQSDTWAFEEVSLTDDNWLRFELWLYSGTAICLEFKAFTYRRERATCQNLPIRWARE